MNEFIAENVCWFIIIWIPKRIKKSLREAVGKTKVFEHGVDFETKSMKYNSIYRWPQHKAHHSIQYSNSNATLVDVSLVM